MKSAVVACALALAGCPERRANPCDLPAVNALLAAGQVERAANAARARVAQCPAAVAPLATALGELARDAELEALAAKARDSDRPAIEAARKHSQGERDPRALIEIGMRARAAGDEAAARRAFDRARAIAEATTKTTARLVHGEQHVIYNAFATSTLAQASIPWSPDGKYVVFARGEDSRALHLPLGLVVVELATLASFRIDLDARPLFAPDGKHLVLQHGREVSVMHLPTRAMVVSARATSCDPVFAPDGRLAWATREGNEDVVYVRDLTSGKELALRTPARVAAADEREAEIEGIVFRDDNTLATWSTDNAPSTSGDPATVRLWDLATRAPRAVVDGLADPEPVFVGERLLYATADGERAQLAWLDLADPSTRRLPKRGACGAGTTSTITPCGGHVILTPGARACVWDLDAKRVVEQKRLEDYDEVTCAAGKLATVYAGPPDGSEDVPPEPDRSVFGEDATDFADSKNAVAGIVRGRAHIWKPTGELLWAATQPPDVVAARFATAAKQEIVAVGRDGRTWHVDLSAGTMRSSAPGLPCSPEAFEVAPDGRALTFCRTTDAAMKLVVEGASQPVVTVPPYNWVPVAAASSTSATAAIRVHEGIDAWSLPDGTKRWSLPIQMCCQEPIAVTPAGDLVALHTQGKLAVHDAKGALKWSSDHKADRLQFSSDGKLLAAIGYQTAVFDAATGTLIEKSPARGTIGFAGDRVAYWDTGWDSNAVARVRPQGIVIRDIAKKQDVGLRVFPRDLDRAVFSIAMHGEFVAAVTADAITVWDEQPQPLATILLAGQTGAVIARDGRVTLFDEAARSLLACRIGHDLYRFEVCEDRARP